jgi:hypothetical protein
LTKIPQTGVDPMVVCWMANASSFDACPAVLLVSVMPGMSLFYLGFRTLNPFVESSILSAPTTKSL